MKKLILILCTIIALFAIAFTVTTCGGSKGSGDDDGDDTDTDDDAGGGHWLRTKQTTYAVQNGIAGDETSSVLWEWISYNYSTNNNYEEEYTSENATETPATSFSYYHYTRNGQTADSETISIAGTTTSTFIFDSESGFTKSSTSISATGASTAVSYIIEKQSDSDGVKTYKYYTLGSTAYSIYKIQEGRTLEAKYYNADTLLSTTTYTLSDNNVIREKLGDYTLYSTSYSSPSYSIKSSFQTAEVLSDTNSALVVRVKTFNDGVLASQTDTLYEKINPNEIDLNENELNHEYGSTDLLSYSSTSDFVYRANSFGIEIIKYKGKGGNVIIPEQIEGLPVVLIGPVAFRNCFKLTNVIIPDSVKYIDGGHYTFYDDEIFSGAFENCIRLTGVKIPYNVKRIRPYAFKNCLSLTSVKLETDNYYHENDEYGFSGLLFYPAEAAFIDHKNTESLSDLYMIVSEGYVIGANPGTYTRQIGSSTWTKQ